MKYRPECDCFPFGTRLHTICNGLAEGMPLEYVNTYRGYMGLPPLQESDLPEGVSRRKLQPGQPTNVRVPTPSPPAPQQTSSDHSQFVKDALFRSVDDRFAMELPQITQDEANRRASICLTCPGGNLKQKVSGSYCQKIGGCSGNAVISTIKRITGEYGRPCEYWDAEQSLPASADRASEPRVVVKLDATQKHRSGCGKAKSNGSTASTGAPLKKPLRSWVSAFTPGQNLPEFITLQQLAADTTTLLTLLPNNITRVAGIARSGLQPATTIAMMLHVPMIIVRHHHNDWIEASNGWRLDKLNGESGMTLFVDDTTMTGNSITKTRKIAETIPGEKLHAAIYVNPLSLHKPDLWVRELSWPHLLEWNLFNSVVSDSMAVDFDGVLCHDCSREDDDDGERYIKFIENAIPKYLARKKPLKLIVTARLEKYRPQTLAWMERWGVRADKLVMFPADTLEERNRANIAKYKAEAIKVFLAKGGGIRPKMFIESDPRQASQIARLTGSLVVCPTIGRCFNGSTSNDY